MSDMGGKAGGLAIIIGWIITAIGMISLAFVFQNCLAPAVHWLNFEIRTLMKSFL
jgi:hypothetical protein